MNSYINSYKEESEALTEEGFTNPKPGYTFTEMYNFWVVVLRVTDAGRVFVMECVAGKDWTLRGFKSIADFKLAYSYRHSVPGYFVNRVAENKVVKDEWVEELLEEYDFHNEEELQSDLKELNNTLDRFKMREKQLEVEVAKLTEEKRSIRKNIAKTEKEVSSITRIKQNPNKLTTEQKLALILNK